MPDAKERAARYAKPGDDGLANDTEREYLAYLEARKARGEIVRCEAHTIKLLIVPGVAKTGEAEGIRASWYTPDFIVYENDMTVSIHETKGYLDRAGDAWLKFKAAASQYPFTFYMVQKTSKVKGSWSITRYAR